jgi:hypothetical protein
MERKIWACPYGPGARRAAPGATPPLKKERVSAIR